MLLLSPSDLEQCHSSRTFFITNLKQCHFCKSIYYHQQSARQRRGRRQEADGAEGGSLLDEGGEVDDDQRQNVDHHAKEELFKVALVSRTRQESETHFATFEPVSLGPILFVKFKFKFWYHIIR